MPFITTPIDDVYIQAEALAQPTDERHTNYLRWCCEHAIATINHYRQRPEEPTVESEYVPLAVEMALYLYNKQGIEGVTNYSENGASMQFEVGSFPPSMLSRITPPAVAL
jgi:hypothetical protein